MTTQRKNIVLSVSLGACGLLVILFAFHIGDLAQQVARAAELLRDVRPEHTTTRAATAELVELLRTIAKSIFAARRWLSISGLVATWIPALARDTPHAIRFGSGALGTLCFLYMLLGRGLY